MRRGDFLKLISTVAIAYPFSNVLNVNSANRIKPNRLKEGGTLGLVAPASPIYLESDYAKMIETLEGLGFNLKEGKYTKSRNGYLAGSEKERVEDLHAMFEDNEIDAILCIRGGYGSNRILDMIDYDLIRLHPKPFIGFSDISSLHLAIQKKTGLVTFHGPVGKSEWNDFSWSAFKSVLIDGERSVFGIPDNNNALTFTIKEGRARGELTGGNLTVVTTLLGSDYEPDWENKILFLEDVGEDIYKIDRMFSQLELNGVLDKINGLVFGQCTACEASSNSLSLEEVLKYYLEKREYPSFYGAMISHDTRNITLPYGIEAEINSKKMTIELLESAVL